jgi:hypothetical protein
MPEAQPIVGDMLQCLNWCSPEKMLDLSLSKQKCSYFFKKTDLSHSWENHEKHALLFFQFLFLCKKNIVFPLYDNWRIVCQSL